jgi:hypothetical protein
MRDRIVRSAAPAALVFVLGFAPAVPAMAQGAGGVMIEPYFGALFMDDSGLDVGGDLLPVDLAGIEIDPAPILGLRLAVRPLDYLGIEGGFGYAPLSANLKALSIELPIGVDGDALLGYGAVQFLVPFQGGDVFFTTGLGAIRVSVEDAGILDTDSTTDPLVELGAGFEWDFGKRTAIRAEFRDHLQICSSDDDFNLCPFDDKALHDLEISAGLSIALGG